MSRNKIDIYTENLIYEAIKKDHYYALSDGERKIQGEAFKAAPKVIWELDEQSSFVGCFRDGTLVNTPHGMVSIETFCVGDKIFSYNELSNEVEIDRVVKLIPTENVELGELFISMGSRNFTQLQCSAIHHYYLPLSKEWLAASELKVNADLMSIDFTSRNVSMAWRNLGFKQTLFNLHVEKNHNYYVHGILVHNMMKA